MSIAPRPSFGPLFSTPDAQRARDTAIQRVAVAADPGWMEKATEAGRHVCRQMAHFTTDDIVAVLAAAEVAPPREARALGAVMVRLREAGLCTPTNTYRESRQVQNHRRPMRVWRSLVVGAQEANGGK